MQNKTELLIWLVTILIASTTWTVKAAPQNGKITAGEAEIKQDNKTTEIEQTTKKAAIDWQQFGLKADEVVNFKQPGKDAITLNRVVGSEKSVINGLLKADGQVWVLNSSGVIFGQDAVVKTSGLLASTKEMSNQDFMDGKYELKGESQAGVLNKGRIEITQNGYAALLGKEVVNEGLIKAQLGTVHLKGGQEFRVNLNGNSLVNLRVEKGELNALVENKEAIRADGGEVYLTTNAVDELLEGVVNNEGIVEAETIEDVLGEEKEGKIEVFAHGGQAEIGGKLTTGAGKGFIETSGREFKMKEEAEVVSGNWLIDPVTVTIDDTLAGNIESGLTNGDVTVNTASNSNNVTIPDSNKSDSNGDIIVDSSISWSSGNRLTLDADRNIIINKAITADNGKLALYYGQGASDGVIDGTESFYRVNAPINLSAGKNFITQLGSDSNNRLEYTVITKLESNSETDLNDIQFDLKDNYVLGADIDASDTSKAIWVNYPQGWKPIGDESNNYKGKFDGLNHEISNLEILRPAVDAVGLFGIVHSTGEVKNVGLKNISVTGKNKVGGLVGNNFGTISNSYSIASNVKGKNKVGGLVGNNEGGINNSYSIGQIKGSFEVGGLVGDLKGAVIEKSYSKGRVKGQNEVGGLVGSVYGLANSIIKNSYSTSDVIKSNTRTFIALGAFIGDIDDLNSDTEIKNSYSTGSVFQSDGVTPLTGLNDNKDKAFIGNGIDIQKIDSSNNYFDKEASNQSSAEFAEAKMTAEMKKIDTFGNWNIVLDKSLQDTYPKLNSGSSTWRISPKSISYDVKNRIAGEYKGSPYYIKDQYTDKGILGTEYNHLNLGEDYKVYYNGQAVEKFEEAGTYENLSVVFTNKKYTAAQTGNKKGSLKIKPRDLVVKADNKEKEINAQDPKLTYTILEGTIVGNDDLKLDLVRTGGEKANRSGYPIIKQGPINQNYSLNFQEGKLVILPNQKLENTISSVSKVNEVEVVNLNQSTSTGAESKNSVIGLLNEAGESNEVTPLSVFNNSFVEIIDNGVNLPEGLN